MVPHRTFDEGEGRGDDWTPRGRRRHCRRRDRREEGCGNWRGRWRRRRDGGRDDDAREGSQAWRRSCPLREARSAIERTRELTRHADTSGTPYDGVPGMSTFRIALANLPFPATPDQSIALAEEAIAQAASE